jgi:hypothetical protein
VAIYDKTVSVDEIRASLDRRYGRWALDGNRTSAVKLWRVESEKFAIQLATVGDKMEEMEGMKQIIYLSFPSKP